MYDFSRFLIIDLEATCWEREAPFQQEVIQFGKCLIEMGDIAEISRLESYYIEPQEYGLSSFCQELTGINPSDVRGSPKLEEFLKTYEDEKDMHPKRMMWGSWGEWDYKQLKEECGRKDIANPYSSRAHHINLKNIHALFNDKKNSKGLQTAMNYHNLDFIGDKHNAKWDALNTARVFLHDINKEYNITANEV